MKLSKIKEIFNAYAVMVDPTLAQSAIAAHRLETCNSCEFMKEMDAGVTTLKICGQCGCLLKAKVFVPEKTSCPEKKWEI